MKIEDIKSRLRDGCIRAVISLSQYMPTEEKLARLAGQYESDPAVFAFGCGEGENVCGAIVLKRLGEGEFEIVSVAVMPERRGEGIASKLVSFAADALKCAVIRAETDDDAVGFYRKCGFRIESLGEKYPGVVRYLCTLKTGG